MAMEPRSAQEEAFHKELEDRSKDIIRVHNPLDIEFKFKYDSRWFKVPAKGYKDWEAFLAWKFYNDIGQYMIGSAIIAKGEKMIEDRAKKGMDEFLDKYVENKAIWDKVPHMDNKDLWNDVAKEVIIGIVEEYGKELPPVENVQLDPIQNPLNKSVSELAAEKFFKRKIEDVAVVTPDADLSKPVKPLKPEVYVSNKDRKKMEQEATVE